MVALIFQESTWPVFESRLVCAGCRWVGPGGVGIRMKNDKSLCFCKRCEEEFFRGHCHCGKETGREEVE